MCPKPQATEVIAVPTPLPQPAPWPVVWAPVFSGGAVVVVGVIAATIAYRQWRTAHTKLQLDLFDKRLPIYKACRSMLARLSIGQDLDLKYIADFSTETADTPLLFDKSIAAFVKAIADAALEENTYRSVAPNDRKTDWVTRWRSQNDRAMWAKRQYAALDALFFPYLRLEKSRTKRPRALEPLPRDLSE